MTNQIPGIQVRQSLLLLLIAVIFGVLFWNLRFFLPALLGAYTLYVLLRGPLVFLTEKWKWRKKAAVAALLLTSFLILLFPSYWIFGMLEKRLIALLMNSEQLIQNASDILRKLEARFGIDLLTPDNINNVAGWGMTEAQRIVNATLGGLGLLLAAYFIVWFMLTESERMERSFFNWLPLKDENRDYVRTQLNDMVWANALGIPLMGLVQGFAAVIVYGLMGVENPWLWFAITFVAGMLPVLGVALAYIPLSLILLAEGMEFKALVIFLYGFIVVGSVDNLARMWLLKKIGHVHPIITLFGVIVGLKLFGFIGFIFGPILIALFILLLRIYQKEFDKPVIPKTP
ncbi:MAG: AI-2E family transporter [Saprospiraceae bacterium]|nr:AI-2E family transporter [Saprospiraceae bacterium]